jgi:hypothetical protein
MTKESFASKPDFTPSIIIGWKPGMAVACGPHQTPFTGTGFGWCYGRKKNGLFMSFDFETGDPLPITDVLPDHSAFQIFAEEDDGYELSSLSRHIGVVTRANATLMISQALLANTATIELAEFNKAGTVGAQAGWVGIDPSGDEGPMIIGRNGGLITDYPPKISQRVYLAKATLLGSLYLDLADQRLVVPQELIPLIDCPGLSFAHKLRQQLQTAYPDRPGPWTIVGQGYQGNIQTPSAQPNPFITAPHAFHRHLAGQATRPFDGRLDVIIKDGQIIAQTDGWDFEGDVEIEEGLMKLQFGAVEWSVLAWRADLRHGIIDKVRATFRTGYDIQLAGLID